MSKISLEEFSIIPVLCLENELQEGFVHCFCVFKTLPKRVFEQGTDKGHTTNDRVEEVELATELDGSTLLFRSQTQKSKKQTVKIVRNLP